MTVYADKLHTADAPTPATLTNQLAHQATRMWNLLRLNKQLARERKHLARLPEHLLADIGIAPEAAQLEAQSHILPMARVEQLD